MYLRGDLTPMNDGYRWIFCCETCTERKLRRGFALVHLDFNVDTCSLGMDFPDDCVRLLNNHIAVRLKVYSICLGSTTVVVSWMT
jgi:hypothetical protein